MAAQGSQRYRQSASAMLLRLMALLVSVIILLMGGALLLGTRVHANELAFTMFSNGQPVTYLLDVDRNIPSRLLGVPVSGSPIPDIDPLSWSPDGSYLAFGTLTDNSLMILDLAGKQRFLANHQAVFDPTWTPDSRAIGFAAVDEVINKNVVQIYELDINMNQETALTHDSFVNLDPSWSPDNHWITFASNRDGNFEIYRMNTDGTQPIQLTILRQNARYPMWSPDGQHIAFIVCDEPYIGCRFHVMDGDGSHQRLLSDMTTFTRQAPWSPDGSQIAFASGQNMDMEIYVIDIDGSHLHRLTNNTVQDTSPRWSPDGQQIAFLTQYQPYQTGINLIDLSSGSQQTITVNGNYIPWFAWRP